MAAAANFSAAATNTTSAGAGPSHVMPAPAAVTKLQNEITSENELAYLIMNVIVSGGNGLFLLALGVGSLIFALRISSSSTADAKKNDESAPLLDSAEPSICAIVPCLLEHEVDVIEGTVAHALACPSLRTVYVTYNTRATDDSSIAPLLARLQKLAPASGKGPELVLQYNASSRSKAANLNAVLPKLGDVDYVLILDADHHVTERFVSQLSASLAAAPLGTACIQGAVLVRGEGCYERVLWSLNWHFFAIVMTAFETLSGSCMFVGAGALWRSAALREYGFDEVMIAEDDDLSMRVIRQGFDVRVNPQAQLTELAPDGLAAFFSQRLRWTFGYEQSLNKHLCGLVCDRPRALVMRLYSWYCYLLVFAGIGQGVLYAVLRPPFTLTFSLLPAALVGPPVAIILVAILVMVRATNGITNVCSAVPIMLCLLVAAIYGFCQAFLTLYARLRMLCTFEWRPTQRKIEK